MKVRNIALACGAAALILLMGSCDALFSNQFKAWGLGQVTNATINEAVTNNDVAAILEQSGLEDGGISDSFLNAATQDQATADAVKALLQETIDDPEAPVETVQAAQVLIIEIELEMNGGGDFIANIVDAISTLDFNNLNFNDPATITNLFAKLFPSREAKALPEGWTEQQIADLIDSVAGLNGNIQGLIDTLNDPAVGQFIPAGIDAGWIAQVGAMVRILNLIEHVNPPYLSVGKALAALIDDGTNPDLTISVDAYISNTGTILNEIMNDPGLNTLFEAAGWDLSQFIPANP